MKLTIFSSPKSFTDHHTNIIQRNAIQSWTKLNPKPEIILFGDDNGVSEIAHELGLIHIPNVKKSFLNTPMLNSMFYLAYKHASNDYLCYINADIILFSDFLETITKLIEIFPIFLGVGRRTDLNYEQLINFNNKNWDIDIINYAKQFGKLHSPEGIDYFVYPKGTLKYIKPFIIGRPNWDNWLLWFADKKKIPIIELTFSVFIIHQNHDYLHIKKRRKSSNKWAGPETDINRNLSGTWLSKYSIKHSVYYFQNNQIKNKWFNPKARKMLIILQLTVQQIVNIIKSKLPQSVKISGKKSIFVRKFLFFIHT